jgi:hypothetical protein
MLKAVFPIAVGPIMVIRYFIFFLAQMGTETPQLWKLVFLGVKERLEEAPFKL